MSARAFRPAPHWWPEGEPWPPAGRHRWRRRRRGFFARIAAVFVIVLSLSAYGAVSLFWTLTGDQTAHTTIALLWILFPLLVIGFGMGMRLVGRPLSDVVGAADRVAAGDFGVRIPEHGPPSLRSVATAFNSMTSRLEEQQQARRALMADIAHELRTPLAVMQGRLEGMIDGVYPRDEQQMEKVLADARMLARLVEDLRTLAHTESGTLALSKEPTDLIVLLNDVVATLQPEATSQGVEVRLTAAEPLPIVEIDPLRIREVVINLLSNALRHSAAGSRVDVDLEVRGSAVALRVSDRGSAISPEDLPHVFDRFYKGSGSSGSGLGLTIAKNLVTAHGGAIAARPRPGGGTAVEISLPLSAF